jgi:SOS-response transcriptional repressor LexA
MPDFKDDMRAVEARLRISGRKEFAQRDVAAIFREIDDYSEVMAWSAAHLLIKYLEDDGVIRLLDHGTPQEWTWR